MSKQYQKHLQAVQALTELQFNVTQKNASYSDYLYRND